MKLAPSETDLVGHWIPKDGGLIRDQTEERIEWLIRNQLEKVALGANGAWEVLYRDRQDGRYWELTYPQGEMHGGGPRRLTHMHLDAAKAKYGISN